MRKLIVLIVATSFVINEAAQAQIWGYGMYGAAQPCPYNYSVAPGAVSERDAVRQDAKDVDKAQQRYNKAEMKLRKKYRAFKKIVREVRISNPKYRSERDDIIWFLENDGTCDQVSVKTPPHSNGNSAQNGNSPSGGNGRSNSRGDHYQFQNYLCSGQGRVNTMEICRPVHRRYDTGSDSEFENADRCQHALSNLGEAYNEWKDAEDQKVQAKDDLDNARSDLKSDISDYKDALEQAREDSLNGICIKCLEQGNGSSDSGGSFPWRGLIDTAATLGGIALGAWGGMRLANSEMKQTQAMGWPSQAFPDPRDYYPLQLGLMGGAIAGGIANGAFGCSPTMAGGGWGGGPYGMAGPYGLQGGAYGPYGVGMPFGYPTSFYGPQIGGGMYMPGMMPGMAAGMPGVPFPMYGAPGWGGGIYGMPGMYGYSPFGAPGINLAAGFGINPYSGFAGGMMPGMGIMGGFGVPGVGFGGPIAGPYGYPPMGMPFGGGMPGMGMPYGYGGGPGLGIGIGAGFGMPGMMGMPGFGMPGMGMGFGMPGMGMPYGGMPGFGAGYGPYLGMGMPGIGLGAGIGAGFGMPGMPGMGGFSPYGLGAGPFSGFSSPGFGALSPYGMGGGMSPYGMGGGMSPYGMGGGMSPYGMGGMMSPYGGGGLGGFQMQQMMMQEQLAQYQQAISYFNSQQQALQNAMAQYRLISSLQAEMESLQMRLQQAYLGMGGGFGGVGLGTSVPGAMGAVPGGYLSPLGSTPPTGFGR